MRFDYILLNQWLNKFSISAKSHPINQFINIFLVVIIQYILSNQTVITVYLSESIVNNVNGPFNLKSE